MNYQENQRNGILAWHEDDRPREKLISKGKNGVSNSELIAILLGTGSGKNTAVDLGRLILELAENRLDRLAKLSISELCTIKGIGTSKAVSIVAALELGKRKYFETKSDKIIILKPEDAAFSFEPYFENQSTELFYAMFLNNSNVVLGIHLISKGGLTSTIVDCRVIFKMALDSGATSIILAHNHPSGTLKPSSQDLSITKELIEAGKIMKITILDHFIFGERSFRSMLRSEDICFS
jgi:DNA repair protein RadC